MNSSDKSAKPLRCPICRAAAAEAYQPFCSRRCADVDLARWLGGVYAIPVAGPDADEDGTEAIDEAGSEGPAEGARRLH